MQAPRPIRAWRQHRDTLASQNTEALWEALRSLGQSSFSPSLNLRRATHNYYLWMHRAALHNFCRLTLAWGILAAGAFYLQGQYLPQADGFFLLFIFLPTMGLLLTFDAPGMMRQHRLVGACARAIRACDAARSAEGGEKARSALREASVALRSVERAVFRARSASRTIARGRRVRHAALRQHAGKVVAALRAAETRLDIDEKAALEELAGLLARISSSSADGRIGALLPENLTTLEPARSYEVIRMAAAAVLFLGVIFGVSVWEIPDPGTSIAIYGAGIISAGVAFGHHWRRAVPHLESMQG